MNNSIAFCKRLCAVNEVLMLGVTCLACNLTPDLRCFEQLSLNESIRSNFRACSFRFSETRVTRAFKHPFISFFLENQWCIIESATDISIFFCEATTQDGVALVRDFLGTWFRLRCNDLCSKFNEVHLAIVGGESQTGSTG